MSETKSQVERHGAVVGLKENMVDRYRELHSAVWPEVLELITRTHITNYSIYLRKLPDGHSYLFSYLEYAGENFADDMEHMIANPIMKRWWAECVPCLELFPDRAPQEVWSPVTEVFHLD
jgi:L-rhamnose mutarotase